MWRTWFSDLEFRISPMLGIWLSAGWVDHVFMSEITRWAEGNVIPVPPGFSRFMHGLLLNYLHHNT